MEKEACAGNASLLSLLSSWRFEYISWSTVGRVMHSDSRLKTGRVRVFFFNVFFRCVGCCWFRLRDDGSRRTEFSPRPRGLCTGSANFGVLDKRVPLTTVATTCGYV